ncbi:pro-Pol polyprotein [Trichonephila clavata]|uniref:Pro-Pol polyprotein n=1 Tax=Trichonephila clavata TaxID=2740835 RepID=A0A8X6GEW1_TRICU|nr:pro-Pol polyprotein [Trichonephila clavata]
MCGVILYPLVESSLPINVLRSFERQRKSLENELKLSSLDAIIHFLKTEVETEEKIRLSRTDIFHFSSERKNAAPANSRDRKPSATELFSQKSNDNSCMFCFKNHETRSCKEAYFIPLDEKLSVIKRKGLCRICLTKGNLAKLCSSSIKCNLCSERHLKLMCPNLEVNKFDQIPKQSFNDMDERITDTLKFAHKCNA